MRSTFYGLEIARKGLFASQKGLDVTGHNIANANTPGYTRQRLVTSSIEPGTGGYGQFTYTAKGQVGSGVTIQELSQIRDKFIDMQYRKENTALGEWTTRTDALQYIESIFREPSDAGLNAVLADFFTDIQEMAKNPESKEIRALVRQDAIKLTETLHHYHDQMIQLQREQDTAIDITVNEINDIIKNIRDLNEQIFRFEIGGDKANDLRDKRNVLVDELSSLIKIEYYETSDGKFRVDINGMVLVDHNKYQTLKAVKDVDNPAGEGLDNLYSIKWSGTNIDVAIGGGKLKGYLDIRDGNSPDRMGIPYFVKQLNTFAGALAAEFNRVHEDGWTLPEGDNESRTGIEFFTHERGQAFDPSLITAKNITLSQDIIDSVYNIAASGQEVDMAHPDKQGDNAIALRLAGLRDAKTLPMIGSFENFAKRLIADLAVESSHSQKMLEGQQILTDSLEVNRLSISGVSLDEEMTMMIQYQHAYAAAARTISVMDEALEILINRTGLVGR
ncbi:MAG TPA: flagellar hook-associated protein FlgK [Clostridia bacterium]|nr:flagellar hook-associated protein FlgK [Clostridia bacterium]